MDKRLSKASGGSAVLCYSQNNIGSEKPIENAKYGKYYARKICGAAIEEQAFQKPEKDGENE